ncbi:MAG: phosphate ABC transporter permease PtsA [Planctomycetota bacterium]|nr:MAG: phosphate ABC transporter permease PtsA [Planctomycetota bacterium]
MKQAGNTKKRQRREKMCFWGVRIISYLVVLFVAAVLLDIIIKGAPRINWAFLTEAPGPNHTTGGVFPAIVGTFCLIVGSMAIALPVGVFTAIYLSEYARNTWFTKLIRLCITNLAGLPSIVFGLFGLGVFVILLQFGKSLLAGWLTLCFMILPVIITTGEQALRSVPKGFREGSLAVGATKWQMIRTNVLPYSLPGILTGSILSVARVAGETAPILFTVAAFYTGLPKTIFSQVEALPYYLYTVSVNVPNIQEARPTAYGAALVLITLVFGLNMIAMTLRAKLRKKHQW